MYREGVLWHQDVVSGGPYGLRGLASVDQILDQFGI